VTLLGAYAFEQQGAVVTLQAHLDARGAFVDGSFWRGKRHRSLILTVEETGKILLRIGATGVQKLATDVGKGARGVQEGLK